MFSAVPSAFIAADDWSANLNITAEITAGEPSRLLSGNPIRRFGVRPTCTNDFEFGCDTGQDLIVLPEELKGYFDYPNNQGDGFGAVDPLKLLTSRIPDAAVLTWPLRLEVALTSLPRDIDVTIISTEIVDIPVGDPVRRVVLLDNVGSEIADLRLQPVVVIPLTITTNPTIVDFDIRVAAGPQLTTAVINAPATANEGDSVQFDGSASIPAENETITDYDWAFSDGGTANGQIVQHTFDDDGPFTATLTVTDSANDTDPAVHNITINNLPPVINQVDNSGPVNEGTTARITTTATDPGADDIPELDHFFDCDDNNLFEVGPQPGISLTASSPTALTTRST